MQQSVQLVEKNGTICLIGRKNNNECMQYAQNTSYESICKLYLRFLLLDEICVFNQ